MGVAAAGSAVVACAGLWLAVAGAGAVVAVAGSAVSVCPAVGVCGMGTSRVRFTIACWKMKSFARAADD